MLRVVFYGKSGEVHSVDLSEDQYKRDELESEVIACAARGEVLRLTSLNDLRIVSRGGYLQELTCFVIGHVDEETPDSDVPPVRAH